MTRLLSRFRFSLLLCSLGTALVGSAPAADTRLSPDAEPAAVVERCWPLDLETRYLTGNFMEPRGTRFHAGLDLKTYSRTGYPVLAAEDGWVSRVRFSATGYGQALYLTTPAGTTYVYAHLERLRDDLRTRVRARQEELGRYAVDLWLGRGELPVSCGEVLALSGQSAAGGPHLHFEVRGADGQPLDPMAHGFTVNDRMAPEILAVRAVGFDRDEPASWLHGDGQSLLAGRLPDLHLADGPLHFSALIIERSDRQRHRLHPWRVRLLLDGREVFTTVNDRLHWEANHHQRLEFVVSDLGQELWLYRDGRNQLAGRQAEPWLAAGAWPPGVHELQLIAEDRAGNTAEVTWRLRRGAAAAAAGNSGWQRQDDVRRDRWLIDPDLSPDRGQVAGTDLQWLSGPLVQPVPDRFWLLSGLQPTGLPVQFRSEDGQVLLEPVALTLPADMLAGGAALVGQAPVDSTFGDPTLGLYRLQRQRWVWAAPLAADLDGLEVTLERPGVYRVLQDRAPPVIATAGVPRELVREPARQRGGISLPRWPVLRIPVADHGSGIDWNTLDVRLAGQVLIVEPDPPRDRILVELPDRLPAGAYRLDIAVADRAGHRARAGLDLDLREPESVSAGAAAAAAEAKDRAP